MADMQASYLKDKNGQILEVVDATARATAEAALPKTELNTAINTALATAKESGEFDGYSPVRGTDYWTEADKAEIKAYVDDAILGGEW